MRSAAYLTVFSLIILLTTGSGPAYAQDAPPPNPHVVIETTMGDITIESVSYTHLTLPTILLV